MADISSGPIYVIKEKSFKEALDFGLITFAQSHVQSFHYSWNGKAGLNILKITILKPFSFPQHVTAVGECVTARLENASQTVL